MAPETGHYLDDNCPGGHRDEFKLVLGAGFPPRLKPQIGGEPVGVSELATIIGTIVADPSVWKNDERVKEVVDAFAHQLEPERLAPSIVRLQAMKKVLDRVMTVWEERYGTEMRGVDYFDENDEQWVFTATERNEITDPAALIESLHGAGVSLRTIAEAITKSGFRVTDLREIVKTASTPERASLLRDILNEFSDRKAGPKHLTLRK